MSAEEDRNRESPEIELGNYIQLLSRRRWLVVTALAVCCGTALAYILNTRPVYSATTMILIEKERRTGNFADGMIIDATAEDYYQTQYELLTSRSLLTQIHKDLGLGKSEDFKDGFEALEKAVDVSPIRRSRLVNVSVESHDPRLAAMVANALAETFVTRNIEGKLFISKEIMGALFPGKTGPSGPAPAGSIDYDSLPVVVNSKLIQDLKGIQAKLEAEWGDLSHRYTSEHPMRLRLKSQMEALNKRIKDETLKIVEGLRAELSGKLQGNNIRVIDRAVVPESPAKPRKSLIMAVAIFLGLTGGFLLALGVDSLDQSIHTQEDIERVLELSFLGSVPMAVFDDDTMTSYSNILSGPKSFTGEALKNIRTMIGFSAPGKKVHSILITSTGQGEGKTFIAISLSIVFSQLGERVLLIEGDMRRPSLHKRFGLSRERGISQFLAHGKDLGELETLIQSTKIENLDVLPCGHIPPNPSELLSTPRLEALLGWAQAKYDRVIVDGTPVFPITDALLWAKKADLGTFVVKFNSTNAKLAKRASQKLKGTGLKIAGAVVNQVTARAQSYGDYYYYYYYYHNSDYTNPVDKPARQT